jgi:hypothetical protein
MQQTTHLRTTADVGVALSEFVKLNVIKLYYAKSAVPKPAGGEGRSCLYEGDIYLKQSMGAR